MTDYLSEGSAYAYFEASQESYYFELIPTTIWFERLHALKSMCSPHDPTKAFVEHILRLAEYASRDEWYHPEDKTQPASDADDKESVVERYDDEDFGPLLRFTPASSTGLSQWIFHQYDPDFFPSIPHGHYQGQAQQKLDAYLGWVYIGAAQKSREPRKRIIALWNDSKFRDFARNAVSWYSIQFPGFRWRVSNPLKLPRRRRP